MNGLTIKEILRRTGHTQLEIADLLGMSNQNLSAALSKDDIRSSLIERIAEAIGQPVSLFYGDTNIATASGENSTAVAGNGNKVDSKSDKFLQEIAAQRKMTERSQDQIDRLLGIIENFKEGK